MKRLWAVLIFGSVLTLLPFRSDGGSISYVAIPANQSDTNCGISRNHGYTTAIDGGNSRGTDRLLNGITLYALGGAGQNSATADNCTLNALSGTLTDAGLTSKNVQAEGAMRDVMSDMVFNNAGGDNSQVEIVLDPESLEQGSTYDLRVYVGSSSGQNRQVKLTFFGDGQSGSETGFFNEDDARTSPGGFATAAQVYYINYRYTWDGDSTPGITISQKFGGAPFCLYALTNELVEGEASTAAGGPQLAEGDATNPSAGEAEPNAQADEGLSSGLVDQESDEVGVESDDFYGSESLNSHGRWVKLEKWGTCWQPTEVASGWSPYTNGSWKECDDCGWTFVSDEPWAWACYHYGRWAKVGIGCGWAWVPGKVWAPSWVSWRQGRNESCNCIGWAPLPPEAGCELNVGISSWVDSTCNIGPEFYTFINIRDFGADSYFGSGCIYDRGRNITIIIDTFNITNILWNRHVNIYCGGPDFNWCNTRIRQLGGKECGRIHVNRYSDPARLGGKFARRDGEQLGLVSPHVRGTKHPKLKPQIAETAGADKIDHGWKGIKDKKQEQQVRNHIAQETKGRNPRNSPAKLPEGVSEKLKQTHGNSPQNPNQGGGQADGLHPGGKRGRKSNGQDKQDAGNQAEGQAQTTTGAGGDQHPGKRKGQGQGAATGGNDAAGGGGNGPGTGTGFDQHPGKRRARNPGSGSNDGGVQATGGDHAGGNAQGANGEAGRGKRHPGQSLKHRDKDAAGASSAGTGAGGQPGSNTDNANGGRQHAGAHDQGKGREKGPDQQAGDGNSQGENAGDKTKGEGTGTRRRKGRRINREGSSSSSQTQGGSGQQAQQSSSGQSGAGGNAGSGHVKRQRQQHGTQQNQSTGGQNSDGQGHGQQKQQQQQQQQQQKQQQQQIQQQGQQGGGGGGGRDKNGRRRKSSQNPPPG